jgi:broad specificity phosphatase PhoE
MTILLVRHGETIDNASHTFQMPSSPLSLNGNKQAEQLSTRLVGANISDIVCSDYLRTKETASYTAKRLGIESSYTALLRERNFGDIRGRSYASLDFDPFALAYAPVNGETWAVFDSRIQLAWKLITTMAQEAKGDLLVITHGFVCRSIVANHTSLNTGLEIPLRWGNTSLTEIEAISPWHVRRLNCTEHLGADVDRLAGQSGQV